jgi:hypothetical protein
MEFKFDREEIKAAIVNQCIINMDAEFGFNEIAQEVIGSVKEYYKKRIVENLAKTLDEVAAPLLKEMLDSPYQCIDEWGEEKGDSTTLKEMFKKKLQYIWQEKVNEKGQRVERGYGSTTRIEFIAKKILNEYFKNDLTAEFSEVLKAIKKEFNDSIIKSVNGILVKKLNK